MRKTLLMCMFLVGLVALSGCNSIKRMTGELDDTVLPGQREEVLPPESQTARDPAVLKNAQGGSSAQVPTAPAATTIARGAQTPAQPCAENDVYCGDQSISTEPLPISSGGNTAASGTRTATPSKVPQGTNVPVKKKCALNDLNCEP